MKSCGHGAFSSGTKTTGQRKSNPRAEDNAIVIDINETENVEQASFQEVAFMVSTTSSQVDEQEQTITMSQV